MTIRVCPPCARFTAFKICKCGKETEEWDDGVETERLAGHATGSLEAEQPAQEDTGLEAAPDQEKEKGPRKAKADQGTEG